MTNFFDDKRLETPEPSRAERDVPMASAGHCTTNTVLGDMIGYRVQGESMLELRHQLILNARPDVADIREQVVFLYGWSKRKPLTHIFDVVLEMNDGRRIAVTIKPEIRLRSGRFLEEMQEVTWWVLRQGFADEVRLLTEADIDPVALHNAEIHAKMRGHYDPEADQMARMVVSALPMGGARSLQALTVETGLADRGYRALLKLVRDRVLRPLRHEKIKPETLMLRWAPEDGFPPANAGGDGIAAASPHYA